MTKYIWTTTLLGLVGLTLLLTPGISQAQRRGSAGRGAAVSNGRVYNNYGGRGYYNYGGRGYYRNYGGVGVGIGLGLGYPYYGGRSYYSPYYYSNGTYADYPRYSYYPDDSTQSNYSPTVPNQLNNPNDAGFIIRVPDPNAEVWFQNYQTQQRGVVRHFESEPLDPNWTYTYTIRARWNQNGQVMDQTRQVNARPGQNQVVDFATPVTEQVPTLPQRQQ